MAVVRQSRHPFAETIAQLLQSITDGGSTVCALIDQAAAARQAGLILRPTSLIVFGNPKGGTPLMDAFPLVALDLPLKLLVWEEDGLVHVAYNPPSDLVSRYDIIGNAALISAMDRALNALVDAIS